MDVIAHSPHVLFEVPSNILLKITGPHRWIPIVMIAWGTIMMAMSSVKNANGLLAARFFLGVTEAGLFPGTVYYLSLWYTRKEQALRNALFFSAATLAGAFGGVLAYGILLMSGLQGLKGWQWIFILEGLPTVLLAFIAYFYLPDFPETAFWLTDSERSLLNRRLAQDAGVAKETSFSWKQFFDAFRDWKVYLHMAIYICVATPLYSLSLFLPTIINNLGFTSLTAQLMTAPPYAGGFYIIFFLHLKHFLFLTFSQTHAHTHQTVGCFFTIALAITGDYFRERGLHMAVPAFVAMIGYILLIVLPASNPKALYGATIITVTGVFSNVPAMLCWFTNNIGGHTKRGVATAAIISFGNIGGAIGGQIYRANDVGFVHGHTICACLFAVSIVFILLMKFLLIRENKRRDNLTPEQFAKEANGEELADWHPAFRYIS
ncbi:major facilitator superfamily domain-containing protein [Endogone sp. FLAS-F59071]|nr:major facilitator superfamily domain-containing protein [Endogone sp. FLAS-F59071]|eukprot:RUS17451.1 major facilitator superfamily domain-containing protein [Endogone sp. FLAS-F59071]